MPNATRIEKQLEQEFLEASRICQDMYGYNPTRFLQMLNAKGAVETAKQLVMDSKYHGGLTKLWKLKRLDLAVEAIIIREPYCKLFSDEILVKAKEKLNELGYTLL